MTKNTKEEILAAETFKEDGLDPKVRIYYTLASSGDIKRTEAMKKDLNVHRVTKAFGILVEQLLAKGVISDADIDEMLFESLS